MPYLIHTIDPHQRGDNHLFRLAESQNPFKREDLTIEELTYDVCIVGRGVDGTRAVEEYVLPVDLGVQRAASGYGDAVVGETRAVEGGVF